MIQSLDMEMFRKQLQSEMFIGDPRKARENAIFIPERIKNKLPKDHKVIGFVLAKDMFGLQYEAILLRWFDENQRGWRVAHFRLESGNYVDDYIL